MSHLRNTIAIDADPDAVWAVLGELEATSEWLPGTVAARMEGSLRVCETADGGVIREEIEEYAPDRRTYRFRHVSVPLPITNSTGRFAVESGPAGGSVVVLESDFDALDPAQEPDIEEMYGAALEQALGSLRRRVEQGVVWQAA